MPRWLRRLMNLLLLPLALLMVVLEDVVWAGALFVLRAVRTAGPVRRVEVWLGTLSGYAVLPLFLGLEVVGLAGKIWAIGLVARGYPVAGLEAYVVIRLGSTLLAVFVYQACAPALLRIGWFAWLVGWVHVARDWAVGLVRPVLTVVRPWLLRVLRRGRGRLALRWFAIRRALRARR